MNRMRVNLVCSMLTFVMVSGCSEYSKTDAGSIGQSIGQNVTEFAQGVGSGVDTQLQVAIELSPELTEAGLSHTIAKQKSALENPEKAISVYLLSKQAMSVTLIAKAYNADDLEIGRATSDVTFAQDDAQYVAFTFPSDMDRQTVKVYRITAKASAK